MSKENCIAWRSTWGSVISPIHKTGGLIPRPGRKNAKKTMDFKMWKVCDMWDWGADHIGY